MEPSQNPGPLPLPPGTQVTSASAVLRLPVAGADDTYAVTSSATSANVQVTVPRRDDSPHAVAVQAVSGSVSVLPAAN